MLINSSFKIICDCILEMTILSQLAFQEIPILSIEIAIVLSCWVVAMLDLLYN